MYGDFAGKVVLVTGGTRGIGRAIAEAFLAGGAHVVVCGRRAPEQPVQSEERQAMFMPVDVRDTEQVKSMVERIAADFGRLDIVVNNAGGSPPVLAADASPRFHESIIRLNLLAPLDLAQRANALMQKQAEGGVILFIGSISALRPSPGTAAYGAAKAGVLSLVRSLAIEWAPKVRVVALSPGLVLTDDAREHYGDEAGIDAVAKTIPLGRLATPADIAAGCLFLASPAAAYAAGSNLVMDGGGERPAFLAAAAGA
ncbi:SDR family oxidoreductase [Noviherbaspirillum saxi]|uniref:SDR family oxidoreductase n=1 Tax=Noviherbaspirillum saxi TaxID=2320863 RepID=A0A3A3FHD8_9BURK|nr:SDR family oxidoreductase [Noviherbaspirillum saxi]RJF92567.1 SDR family oxidoreductase [Noviherbaspirillum saxi]